MSEFQDTAPTSLTASEVEVLRWMAEGKTLQEISVILQKTVSTVKNQGYMLREKLGARTSAQAVAIGFRTGMLT